MPETTPARMDREPLARVEVPAGEMPSADGKGKLYPFIVTIGEDIVWGPHNADFSAQREADRINAAAEAWLDREIKKAVDETFKSIAEFARTEGHDNFGRQILEQRDILFSAIRSAPGKEKRDNGNPS